MGMGAGRQRRRWTLPATPMRRPAALQARPGRLRAHPGALRGRVDPGDDERVTGRRATWWRIAAILATVVAALALSTGTPTQAQAPAPASPGRLTFLQSNLCGNTCNDGRFTVIAQ